MFDALLRRAVPGRSHGAAPVADGPHPTGHRIFDGIARMPAFFGRQGGPRQRPDGDGGYPANAGSTLATWVAARVEPKPLAALLPAGFALTDPLLIVEAITFTGLPWLAGRGYQLLMVSTPVRYTTGTATHQGRLELVTWEDRPDAIISGREELGWNKIYADSMTRYTAADGAQIRYSAAWDGTKFLELHVTLDRRVPQLASWRKGPLMHYRVLPRTGQWDTLDVEQVTAHTTTPALTSMRSVRSGDGAFRFRPVGFEELPTLCHIVNRLAAIELGDTVDAGQARTAAWSDVSDIHIIGSSTTDTDAESC